MAGTFRQIVLHDYRKRYIVYLAFIWIFGLIFGVNLSFAAGPDFLSLMRGASGCSVSIVCLLSVSLLPFLFSAVAVYIRSMPFLAVLCFIKGFLFAFVSAGIFTAFKSAGWLVRILMMFSDLGCLVPLWWCWISCVSGRCRNSVYPVLQSSLLALCIISLDYVYVSPLLEKLVEF